MIWIYSVVSSSSNPHSVQGASICPSELPPTAQQCVSQARLRFPGSETNQGGFWQGDKSQAASSSWPPQYLKMFFPVDDLNITCMSLVCMYVCMIVWLHDCMGIVWYCMVWNEKMKFKKKKKRFLPFCYTFWILLPGSLFSHQIALSWDIVFISFICLPDLLGPQTKKKEKHLAPKTKIARASCPKCVLEKHICPKAIKSTHESKQHKKEQAFKNAL